MNTSKIEKELSKLKRKIQNNEDNIKSITLQLKKGFGKSVLIGSEWIELLNHIFSKKD